MINLIPNGEKKKMQKAFYLRFSTVLFFSMGLSTLFVLLAVLPSYVLLSARENVVNSTLEGRGSGDPQEMDQKILSVAEEINTKLDLVTQGREARFSVSEKIINELIASKMSDIRITAIAYEIAQGGEKKVRLRGSAPSRERLVVFRRALEDSLAWKQVDLPISNFVKGSNIEFSLTLVPS